MHNPHPEPSDVQHVGDLLAAAGRVYGSHEALVFADRRLTYAELADTAERLAGGLAAAGATADEPIGVLFPNCPQFVVAFFGASRLGALVVPVSTLLKPEEMAYILNNAGVGTLLAHEVFQKHLGPVREMVPGLKRIVVSGESAPEGCLSFDELIAAGHSPPSPPDQDPDSPAVLIYTSGTTGRPKGAMLTHHNLLSNTRDCVEVLQVSEQETWLTVLPLFHSFGLTACMLLSTMVGGRQVLVPRFAPAEVMRTIEAHRPTLFLAVPPMFAVLLGVRTEREYDLSSLTKCVSGGAPLPMELARAWEQRTGCHLHEGYGPTEASPVVSVIPLDRTRPGSAGLPIASVEVCILDDEREKVAVGEVGEVAVRGPNVFAGYWQDEAATRETMHGEWLLTGDMGRLDEEGYLYIVDRKKDLVIVGGMNVYPSEVEQVLYELPAVAQAAVIGLPSQLRGEDVIAVLALKPDAELTETEVIDACAARLGAFKVPRRVVFLPELPVSPTGKILKRELRDVVPKTTA